MSSTNKISPTFLANRIDTAGFLNSRRNFTRELGKNETKETEFIAADDNPNRKLSAFRGIGYLNPSPFGTRPLSDFRGIVKFKYDGFVNPQVHINDGPIDNRYQVEPGRPVFTDDNPREAEEIDYGQVEDWVYLKQHPEVGDLLAEDEKLRERYFCESLDSDYQLEEQISGLARQRLDSYSPLNDRYLDNNPDEARLIALNVGGTADTINSEPEIAESLTEETREGYSDDIRSELADNAASKFNPETGLDHEFFRENPEAAAYLNKRPGLIERFNQRPSDAENFKRFYQQLKGAPENEAMNHAETALSGQGEFVGRYLEDDRELAFDVAVDRALKSSDSMADNINRYGLMPDKYVFPNKVYDGHLSAAAGKALEEGNTFDREYFSEHPNLALAIYRSPALTEGLKSASGDIDRFFGSVSGASQHRRNAGGAVLAFSSGYPLRESTLVDLWT